MTTAVAPGVGVQMLERFGEAWNRHVDGCDVFTFRNGRIAVKSSYFKQRAA